MLSDYETEGREINSSHQPTAGKFKLRLRGLSTPPGSHTDCRWAGVTSVPLFSFGKTAQMAGKNSSPEWQGTNSSTTAAMRYSSLSTTCSFHHTNNDHPKMSGDRKSYNMLTCIKYEELAFRRNDLLASKVNKSVIQIHTSVQRHSSPDEIFHI